jgi:colanic acid/amylovoran biosynthesis glycosyltransferase
MLAESIQYGVRIERARVIYSGVELQGLAEKPLCIEDSTVRLLIIGRMHWIKGYSYLLDCLQILKERGVAVNATIIAGGDVPEEFLYHVHEAGLSQIVELRGSLPHAEVIAEMSKHHALVLPSVAEGIANVVLEAMSNGLLVISTDCGGMREVVCDGINGFLISVRDAEAMANAVIKLKALSKEEINQLRRNAYRTVEQKFKLAANIKNFVELYQSLN